MNSYLRPNYTAGDQSGTSWANAKNGAVAANWQAAFDMLGDGETMFIGSGEYGPFSVNMLNVITGGIGSHKKIIGAVVDTEFPAQGTDRPRILGNWSLSNPTVGVIFLQMRQDSRYLQMEGLQMINWRITFTNGQFGRTKFLTFRNMYFEGFRNAILIRGDSGCTTGYAGSVTCPLPLNASSDIIFDNITFFGGTRNAIDLRQGVYNVLGNFININMGGQTYAVEPLPIFQQGFKIGVGNTPDRDMEFNDCTFSNSYVNAGINAYWNGDGFSAERYHSNIIFNRCKFTDCTDGGVDSKSPFLYNDCLFARNKRGARLWNVEPLWPGQKTRFNNCLFFFCKRWGDFKGSTLHASCQGNAEFNFCTFFNMYGTGGTLHNFFIEAQNADGINPTVDLNDCILAADATSTHEDMFRILGGGTINYL